MFHSCLLCLTLGLAVSSPAATPPLPATSSPTRAGSPCAEGLKSRHLEVVYRRVFLDRVTILQPRFPGDSRVETTTYVTYSGGRLEARDPRTGRSLWPAAIRCAAEPILLRVDKNRHVFASKHHFFAIATSQGHQLWQLGEPAPDDPNVDPESLSTITEIEMRGDYLFAIRDRCEVSCIDVFSGNLVWRMPIERGSVQRLLSDDNVLYISNTKPREETVVFAVATRSGMLRRKLTLPRVGGDVLCPHALLPSRDDTFLITTPDLVAAIAKNTGQIRWQIGPPTPLRLSTIKATKDSLFYGSIAHTIARHRLQDGKRLWATAEIGQKPDENMWMTVTGDSLFIATSGALAAINRESGRCRWIVQNPGALDCHPPIMTPHAIFTITPEAGNSHDHHKANTPRTRYRIRCFDRATGSDLLRAAPAITEPLESLGGMYVRGNTLILLDATRTIGYVRRAGAF